MSASLQGRTRRACLVDARELRDRSPAATRAYVRVRGPGAADYLQRMLSNDVLAGDSVDALLLTPKARVIAPLLVVRRAEDDFLVLTERGLPVPYTKDYDALPGEGPLRWPETFDVSRWGLFAARAGGRRVGGAAVACGDADLDMLEGCDDLAILWDIRVAPEARGHG